MYLNKMKTTTIGIILGYACFATAWEWAGNIVFEDNFNGASLDLNKWDYEEGCGPGKAMTKAIVFRIWEWQPALLHEEKNNVAVRNGTLVITARRENMEDKEYTSGRIRQKAGFAYGAYVVRAKLSRGDHLWSALWLLHEIDECRYEEIDIAEYRGQPSQSRNLKMAGHWGRKYDVITSRYVVSTMPSDLSSDYHEFAVLWVPSKIEWYVDKEKYFAVSLKSGTFNSDPNKWPCRGKPVPFTEPANFIFNIAVGGSFFTDYPPPDPNTWTKPTMEIDWVRVYQS